MKRIGLTQRVETIKAYGEIRDCLDQAWTVLLMELGLMPVPLPNHLNAQQLSEFCRSTGVEGVILTGGNDLASTGGSSASVLRDRFEQTLIKHCIEHRLPVLGVCRGMQMLNEYFGGRLQPVSDHVAQNHTVVLHDGRDVAVNSYHDWGIMPDDLAADWRILGQTADGVVEYVVHRQQPLTAIMWHPERPHPDEHFSRQIITEVFK